MKIPVLLVFLFVSSFGYAASNECTTASGAPSVNQPFALSQVCDQVPIKFSFVDSLTGSSQSWNGGVPFANQVILRSKIPSLQGADTIPVVPGGSALAALGPQYSDLYQSNRPLHNSLEKTFKAGYFAAIKDAEAKIASSVGSDADSLEHKIGAQYVEALTVFDPNHPDALPKSMVFGGSVCTHADGRVTSGGMQVATAPDCADGTMVEVFAVYSLDFIPTGPHAHLGITLKSAGMQTVAPGASAQIQFGNSLSNMSASQ